MELSHLFLSKKSVPFDSSFTRHTHSPILVVKMKKKLIMCLFILLKLMLVNSSSPKHSSTKPNAETTVMGFVYCDVCSNNSFSRHSYFMSGVEVRIICRFKAASSRTNEMITFSANRTTNEFGFYKLAITSLDCVDVDSFATSCQASLVGRKRLSDSSCNVPGYRTTTDTVVFKSKRYNTCMYGFSALNFRPFKRNFALCGKK